jgi:high-affinity iron transporter
MAYLKQAEQSRLNPWVFAGIAVGAVASLMVGIVFNGLLVTLETTHETYAPIVKQALEGGFGLVAIALLSWMLIWMTRQAKSLKSEIEGTITSALQTQGAEWAVFSLITIAVLREGFETVIFITANFQQGWMPVMGAVMGLTGAVVIGFMFFQLGVKINLRRFFQIMGVLLLLIVAGLIVSSLRHFDQAVGLWNQANSAFASPCPGPHTSCILGPLIWDTSDILPDRQFPGILLKAFLGYTQTLYFAQAIAYLLFLSTVGSLYLRSTTNWRIPRFDLTKLWMLQNKS